MDLGRKAFVRVIPTGPRTEGIAVAPDGSTVWAGSNTNGTVSVVETKSGTIVETLTGFSLPYRLAISADGETAITCDPQGSAIHVADVATRKVVWKLDALGSPRGVTIAPDGKRVRDYCERRGRRRDRSGRAKAGEEDRGRGIA